MKRTYKPLAVPLAVFLVVSALYLTGSLERLELMSIDLRYRFSTWNDAEPGTLPLSVVTLDQNSLKGLGRWPLDRSTYAIVIDNIVSGGALGVLIDVDFSSAGPDPVVDAVLASSVERAGSVVLAAQMNEKITGDGVLIRNLSLPYPDLRNGALALGSITFEVDPDGVLRRMPPIIDNIDETFLPLGVVGARMVDLAVDTRYPAGSMINMRTLSRISVPTIPFLKVLNGDFPRNTFEDRVVLIGATAPDLHDLWLTPMGITPGVFIQAAVADTVLAGNWIVRQSSPSAIIMILVLSLITGWLMGRSAWKRGSAVLLLSLTVVGGFSILSVAGMVFVQVVPLLLVCLTMYPVQMAARLRKTDKDLARELKKTEAFIGMTQLRTAEEKGQEAHLIPLVLLNQILGLTRITVCLEGDGPSSPFQFHTVTGEEGPQPSGERVREVMEKGFAVTFELPAKGQGILVPMATVRQTVGVLYVETTNRKKVEDSEIKLLLSFATHTAYFIESHALDLRVKDLYINTIRAISRALDSKDQYTSAHSELSIEPLEKFGHHCGLGREQIEALHAGALLHDIGKIGIPDSILAKETDLSGEEFKIIREHPIIGSDIIGGLPFPEDVRMIIRHHHERFDGTGYPDGLKGEEIPRLVRIFSILDVYEALVGFRPYREPLDVQSAARLLREGSGTQFDPELVDLFIECILDTPVG